MKQLFTHFLFFCCLLYYQTALTQPVAPAKVWDNHYGGSSANNLFNLVKTNDGGYLLGGISTSDMSGDKSENHKGVPDYWIVKIDSVGNQQWDKTFGGNSINTLKALVLTSDGGYLLGGYSDSDSSYDKSENSRGGFDYWIIKIDASGNKIWDKTFGGSGSDQLNTICRTWDGGYVLGGSSGSDSGGEKSENSRGNDDYWMIKIDGDGNKQWDKTFGGSDLDHLMAVEQTLDSGYILGGHSYSNSSGDKSENSRGYTDYWIIKVDSTGNKQWDKTFGGNSGDQFSDLQITDDGGYILGGASWSDSSGEKSQNSLGMADYWIVRIDEGGNKLWDKTLGAPGDDEFHSLLITSDQGYLLGGISNSNINGDKTDTSRGGFDYWILKTDSVGNKQWDKTFGGSDDDAFYAFTGSDEDGFLVGGFSSSPASGDKSENNYGWVDYWILKTTSACVFHTFYADNDGDGFGNLHDTISVCDTIPPSGYVTDNTDCDDTKLLYSDNDGDGYGAGSPVACGVENNTDCNDNDASIHPGAAEICGNGIDDNCDGEIDEGCTVDNGIRIMIKDNSIYEGNRSVKYMRFAVRLNKRNNDEVTVNYATQDGTAIAGSDYYAQSGTIVFPRRTRKVVFTVPIIGDNIPEPNETFTINLSNPVNASIEKGVAVATIVNDDGNMISKPNGQDQHQSISIEQQSIKLIPNPAQSKVNVVLTGFKGKVSLELRSLDGRLLKVQDAAANAKSIQEQLDISNYSAGTYFIIATDENGNRKVEKLVIIK